MQGTSGSNQYAHRRTAELPVITAGNLIAQIASTRNLVGLGDVSQLAFDRDTPPEVLIYLADDIRRAVWAALVENPSAPPAVLARLAQDQEINVRKYVAYNPGCPIEQLWTLSRDPRLMGCCS